MGLLFLVPAVASAVLLLVQRADLSRPWVAAACWLIAVLLQFVLGQPLDHRWLAGLLLNVVLALLLAIRLKVR